MEKNSNQNSDKVIKNLKRSALAQNMEVQIMPILTVQ